MRILWFVLWLTILYLLAEFAGGLITGSLALVADAGHMATDAASIGLSLFAAWIATKPPTDEKTYGYHRAEILAALVNGATLIAIAILIAAEAWRRFRSPQPVNAPLMAWIAIGGLVVNGFCLWRVHRNSTMSYNLQAVWLHLASDALGSLSAVLASLLIWKLGWLQADAFISAFIVILILAGAIRLVIGCVDVLLESVPKGMVLSDIRKEIESVSEVVEVHDLHVWTVTSGVYALSAHVCVGERADHGKVLGSITNLLKDRFHIDHATVQLEPPNFAHPPLHF